MGLHYRTKVLHWAGRVPTAARTPVQTEYARIYNDDSATALVLVQSTATAHTKGFALGEGQEISLACFPEQVVSVKTA